MLKINNNGIAHFLVLAVIVLGLGIFGSYKLVADTAKVSVSTSCKSKVLRVGSTGSCVKQLQNELNIKADGKFGPATKQAVVNYQTSRGLTPDGIVGKNTWAKISGQPAGEVKAQPIAKQKSNTLACTVILPSTVKTGGFLNPTISIKNNFKVPKIVIISGSIGSSDKQGGGSGGGFEGKIVVPANSNKVYRSSSRLNVNAPATTVSVEARVSSDGATAASCGKSVKVLQGKDTGRATI